MKYSNISSHQSVLPAHVEPSHTPGQIEPSHPPEHAKSSHRPGHIESGHPPDHVKHSLPLGHVETSLPPGHVGPSHPSVQAATDQSPKRTPPRKKPSRRLSDIRTAEYIDRAMAFVTENASEMDAKLQEQGSTNFKSNQALQKLEAILNDATHRAVEKSYEIIDLREFINDIATTDIDDMNREMEKYYDLLESAILTSPEMRLAQIQNINIKINGMERKMIPIRTEVELHKDWLNNESKDSPLKEAFAILTEIRGKTLEMAAIQPSSGGEKESLRELHDNDKGIFQIMETKLMQMRRHLTELSFDDGISFGEI